MSKKKKREKQIKSYSSDSEEMYRMLKVLGIVVLALGAFYFIFAIANGEISFGKKETKKEVEIQNIEILAGSSLNRPESEYYVMFYDFDANDSISYANLYTIYSNSSSTNKLYLVDLSKKFNSDYIVSDKTQIKTTSISDLKVINGTLIKVNGGKITKYFVGVEDIKKELFD